MAKTKSDVLEGREELLVSLRLTYDFSQLQSVCNSTSENSRSKHEIAGIKEVGDWPQLKILSNYDDLLPSKW